MHAFVVTCVVYVVQIQAWDNERTTHRRQCSTYPSLVTGPRMTSYCEPPRAETLCFAPLPSVARDGLCSSA